MQSLAIQVQPDKGAGLDLPKFGAALNEMTSLSGLVDHASVSGGDDNGSQVTYTFRTSDVATLWHLIESQFYRGSEFAACLLQCSIVVCTGKAEWDDYLLLYHFDPAVESESIPLSNPTFQRTAMPPLN